MAKKQRRSKKKQQKRQQYNLGGTSGEQIEKDRQTQIWNDANAQAIASMQTLPSGEQINSYNPDTFYAMQQKMATKTDADNAMQQMENGSGGGAGVNIPEDNNPIENQPPPADEQPPSDEPPAVGGPDDPNMTTGEKQRALEERAADVEEDAIIPDAVKLTDVDDAEVQTADEDIQAIDEIDDIAVDDVTDPDAITTTQAGRGVATAPADRIATTYDADTILEADVPQVTGQTGTVTKSVEAGKAESPIEIKGATLDTDAREKAKVADVTQELRKESLISGELTGTAGNVDTGGLPSFGRRPDTCVGYSCVNGSRRTTCR